MLALGFLLAFSLTSASAWMGFHDVEERGLDRRAITPNYVFFCNCWANPGARSEVDFYQNSPTIGQTAPPYSYVVQDGSNYVWQDGGSAENPSGKTFTWTITNKTAGQDQKAGTATDGTNKYTLFRETNGTLYRSTDNGVDYGCVMVYRGQLNSLTISTSSTSSTSMRATSTPATTTGSSPAAATTTDTFGVTATPTPSDTGLSTGTKAGIGAGVAIGVLVLAGIIGFLFWRRRRSTRSPIGVDSDEKKFLPYPTGVGAVPLGQHTPSELHQESIGQYTPELHHEPMVSEMPDTGRRGFGTYDAIPNYPHEMDGGTYPSPR